MEWYLALNPSTALTVSFIGVGLMALSLLWLLFRGRISRRGFFPILILTLFHPFFWVNAFQTPDESQKSGALVFLLAGVIVFFWALFRPSLVNEFKNAD